MKNSFFLVIPKQYQSPDLLGSFDKESINHWIAELPSANASLATRLFHDYIEQINRIEMPAQKRLEILELLRPEYLSIEESLRSRLIKSGFPKSDNDQKILSLLTLIEQNFTISYWIVVKELSGRDVGWLKAKNLPQAIQRTIKGLSGIVISHYMMSLPVPGWVWIDIHSLYKMSVQLKKHTNKVQDKSSETGKNSSIEIAYKQVLLLSLAVPTGLMQKEVKQVYEFTHKIAHLVGIQKDPVELQELQCIIQIDEDTKPNFEQEGRPGDTSMLYLNLLKLYQEFKAKQIFSSTKEARFSSLQLSKNTSEKLPEGLFDYLSQCWQGTVVKGTPIFSDRMDRKIAVGLNATYSLLMTTNEEDEANLEILASSYSDTELSCQFEKEGVLSIGSLVSLRKTNEPKGKRFLGVVIKITIQKQHGQMYFELSGLTPQSFAVTYQNVKSKSKTDHHNAILYGVKKDNIEKTYIIIESFKRKNDDIARLFLQNENFLIVLGNRKNIGLGYWQFECRRILEEQIQADSAGNKGFDFL